MIKNPIVFISYSWDDEPHQNWVLNLANKLVENGIDVILDQYELHLGANLAYFVENSIRKSNTILTIGTPNYKIKAEKRKGGVGHEFSLINNEMLKNIVDNKIIPVLRSGSKEESLPDFMQQYIYSDFSSDENFEEKFEELLRSLYKEPKVKKPSLGKRPAFGNKPPEKENGPTKNIDPIIPVSDKNNKDTISETKSLLGKGDTKAALKLLENLGNDIPNFSSNLIVLNSRLNTLESRKRKGILTLNEINVENNRINYAILGLLDEL